MPPKGTKKEAPKKEVKEQTKTPQVSSILITQCDLSHTLLSFTNAMTEDQG
jgi:hypothetical protein